MTSSLQAKMADYVWTEMSFSSNKREKKCKIILDKRETNCYYSQKIKFTKTSAYGNLNIAFVLWKNCNVNVVHNFVSSSLFCLDQ